MLTTSLRQRPSDERFGSARSRRRSIGAVAVSFVLILAVTASSHTAQPTALSDAEFWEFFTSMSEPGGSFVSENFVSNETSFQDVIPTLQKSLTPGGVYLGVGPEQNYTYIANLKPRMAVIFDIRRQNAMHHLMYKALFDLSPTRAEFVARLFSRPAVAALGGGHGLAASLEALRRLTNRLTAIVTVADDGGSSGRLREEFDILPPGDLRMALAAMCGDDEVERAWAEVLQSRFRGDGPLGGHSIGNLLIAGLWQEMEDPVAGLDMAEAPEAETGLRRIQVQK